MSLAEREMPQNQATTRTRGVTATPISHIQICWQNAWEVLQKYNKITDKSHTVYAAATLLNPSLRRRWFDYNWTGDANEYIQPMLEKNRNRWKAKYMMNTTETTSPAFQSIFQRWSVNRQALITPESAFDVYTNGEPQEGQEWLDNNIFIWWRDAPYSSLRQWAFDILSVPAMSAEIERVFSEAGRLITDDRIRLGNEMIEALTCLGHWSKRGAISM
jgi:hypothetical protein